MLLSRLILPVLANAIPSFAVEPNKFTTVISEDSYKHNVISTQRAVQKADCTDYPPDWAADYMDNDYDCGVFSFFLGNGADYNYICKSGNVAQSTDQDNGLKVKDACCECGGGKICIDDPPDWGVEEGGSVYDCQSIQSSVESNGFDYMCNESYLSSLTDPNGLTVKEACCICGGGKKMDPDWFIIYVGSLLEGGILTSTYNTKDGVGTDYNIKFTDGACGSGETPHDYSVVTYMGYSIPSDNALDTFRIDKYIDAAAIANQHGGSFVFCEKVALTDTGISQTYEVVYAKTQYTITSSFLAEINSYSVTLQDDTIITEESEDLSLTGTVVVTQCGDVSENLNPGDELCLEISETSSNDIGVESINNLNFIQDVATFTAITDGVTQHIDLVSEDCANVPGTCTVKITVPSFMYQGSSGSDTVTMAVSGDVYLYDMSSKNGKAEINSFSFSVKLEKPCEGGLFGSIAKMFSK